MSLPLQGQVILNTRPAHQQAELTQLLEQDGASVLSLPTIDIEAVTPDAALQSMIDDIARYDLLLFVSRNAVEGAFRLIDVDRIHSDTRLGVIGSATHSALAQALAGSRLDVDAGLVAGEPYNSEALLEALATIEVSGRRVLIFRGQQGRNLLGDTLRERGAVVDYAEVYRRRVPVAGAAAFDRVVADGMPGLVILTSAEGMHNLMEMVNARAAEALRAIPWLLISERMRESAQKLGHNAPIVIAQNASDDGIRQTVRDWAS